MDTTSLPTLTNGGIVLFGVLLIVAFFYLKYEWMLVNLNKENR